MDLIQEIVNKSSMHELYKIYAQSQLDASEMKKK